MNKSLKSMADKLVRDIQAATDEALVSAMVFGSAARDEHHASRSDLNLLIAFTACSPSVLMAAGPCLQAAWRSDRVRPYLVSTTELPRVADVFPLKLWDIQTANVRVHGPDLVSEIAIDREHLRLRVEQELRNELIRLRWQIVHNHNAGDELRLYFTRLAHRLRTVFAGLLYLREESPEDFTFARVFERLPIVGLNADALARLSAPLGDLKVLVEGALSVLEGAIRIVDELGDV